LEKKSLKKELGKGGDLNANDMLLKGLSQPFESWSGVALLIMELEH
jgi:hypothetical protein